MIELSRSKKVYLGKSANGRDKFSLDVGIAPIVMRETGKDWEDIKPVLIKSGNKWISKGTPYRVEFDSQGGRRVYPDRTDLTKYLDFPSIPIFSTLSKTWEADRCIAKTTNYDFIFGLENSQTTFQVLMRQPPPFSKVTFNVNSVGFDIVKLLLPDSVPRIPRPRLIDSSDPPIERMLDWLYKNGQLELGFDLTGLTFPVLLRNTTISPDPIIGASADDARESEENGYVTITGATIYVTSSTQYYNRNWGGFRFVSAQFPVAGSTISTCYLTVVPVNTLNDDANLTIHFEELAAPTTFSTTGNPNYNISGRDRTEASVSWVADGLGASRVNSPSLCGVGSPAEEIWNTDNLSPTAIVVIAKPKTDATKTLAAISYDASTTNCATFHIEWEAAGGWANIKNMRMGTGSVIATDLAHIRMGTGIIDVADIASIWDGTGEVAV